MHNIVIGNPLVKLEKLGVTEDEETLHLTVDKVKNEKGQIFLPQVLVRIGMFSSTTQIKQINQQRLKSEKFKNDPDQNLWRVLETPEFTHFKIGKNVFWLIVGEF